MLDLPVAVEAGDVVLGHVVVVDEVGLTETLYLVHLVVARKTPVLVHRPALAGSVVHVAALAGHLVFAQEVTVVVGDVADFHLLRRHLVA